MCITYDRAILAPNVELTQASPNYCTCDPKLTNTKPIYYIHVYYL